MKIIHGGRTHLVQVHEWRRAREENPGKLDLITRLVNEGVITDDDGTPLEGVVLERVKSRLLGRYDTMPGPQVLGRVRTNGEEKRWLVNGVWGHGTIPMLGGNPKAGKTTLVVDLIASLLLPGRRFLGHFEVPPRGFGEQDVWLINAETLPSDLDAEMEAQGLMDRGQVVVDHLETLGGAQAFDITEPEIYAYWAHRFAYCEDCDGSDDSTPFIVIVDGLTAILNAAGKGTGAYGLWYSAFRRLMREVDVPNALVVGHNTLSGSHLMGGVEAQAGADGLWNYSSDNPDDPASRRWFSLVPRLGGVAVSPMQVVRQDGRLWIASSEGNEPVAKKEPVDEVLIVAQRTAAYVAEHPGAGGQELTENVDSSGSKGLNLDGRTKAVELGLIREEPCGPGCGLCERPHHRRRHYWVPDAPD